MSGLCDSLVREHELIERVLDSLEHQARAVAAGTDVNHAFFTQSIAFVRQFADGVHHQKEERVLFPALCDAGMPQEGGPVGVMLCEHDEGRGHIRAMESALGAASQGDAVARKLLVKETIEYVELLRAHIQKENMILFPMAERVLDQSSQDIVQQQFTAAELANSEQIARFGNWAETLMP